MSRLSSEVLSKGRQLIVSSDLQGLTQWIARYAPTVNQDLAVEMIGDAVKDSDTVKALAMFNAAFNDYDASVERVGNFIRIAVPVYMFLGGLGGILYLIRLLFGR